jgi:hypothetical protein
MIDFFAKNYKWIFSGIGVFVLGLIFYRSATRIKKISRHNQKIGNKSYGIQAGRDINIKKK